MQSFRDLETYSMKTLGEFIENIENIEFIRSLKTFKTLLDNGILRMPRCLRVVQVLYFGKTPVYRCAG